MNDAVTRNYTIAGISFSLTAPSALVHAELEDFAAVADFTSEFSFVVTDEAAPSFDIGAKCIYSSSIIDILLAEQVYRLTYKVKTINLICDFDIRSKQAHFYLPTDYNTCLKGEEFDVSDYVFFALKELFFLVALNHEMIPIHSSSLIYAGRAYLFSAPAGTGKSTHTGFWKELYHTPILDGDVTLLSVKEECVYAHGLPWCGTSGEYQNATLPLGAVIFLSRSDSNKICESDFFSSVINLCARSFAPSWTKELIAKVLDVSQKIAKLNPCLSMGCTPIPESAIIAKEFIDSKKQTR